MSLVKRLEKIESSWHQEDDYQPVARASTEMVQESDLRLGSKEQVPEEDKMDARQERAIDLTARLDASPRTSMPSGGAKALNAA